MAEQAQPAADERVCYRNAIVCGCFSFENTPLKYAD